MVLPVPLSAFWAAAVVAGEVFTTDPTVADAPSTASFAPDDTAVVAVFPTVVFTASVAAVVAPLTAVFTAPVAAVVAPLTAVFTAPVAAPTTAPVTAFLAAVSSCLVLPVTTAPTIALLTLPVRRFDAPDPKLVPRDPVKFLTAPVAAPTAAPVKVFVAVFTNWVVLPVVTAPTTDLVIVLVDNADVADVPRAFVKELINVAPAVAVVPVAVRLFTALVAVVATVPSNALVTVLLKLAPTFAVDDVPVANPTID